MKTPHRLAFTIYKQSTSPRLDETRGSFLSPGRRKQQTAKELQTAAAPVVPGFGLPRAISYLLRPCRPFFIGSAAGNIFLLPERRTSRYKA